MSTNQPRTPDGRYTSKAAGSPVGTLDRPAAKTVPPEQLYAVLRSMAGKSTRMNGEDFDDLVQDVAEEVLRSYGGRDAIPLAPLKTIVSRKIDQAKGHTNLDARDRAAMSALKNLIDERSRTLGRFLTNREVEDLARQVRQEWPDPKHRPTVNFLQRARMGEMASIDVPDGGVIEAPSVWGDGRGGEVVDPDSSMAKVEQALEAHKVGEARRQAWDALAQRHGAPLVARGRFEARVRTWCRQTIDDYPGGVMGAVDTWERAEDDEGTTALFAPFGERLDEEGRDAVCAMLRAYPAHADSLWEAALMASVR
ncbi:MAG: hypothetical protein E6640_01925 [Actinomyces urogenitalis]|uniref:hypothetical protein n=1 Tax=Actinomyces urogenitalis TaxID=103621 RepID=UPI002910903C|nr:hypothetical protein [Actinomyces urogenitalis]MDU6150970.1 hypothetical protein [Actinomyces urogenitalis]